MIEYISKNGYFGFNKDGDFIALGYDIAITAVKKNLDGDKVTLQVVFEVSEEVVNTELNYGNMKEVLNEKGYAVSHNNEHHIKEYLQQQATELMINSVYTNLGWCRLDNKISFKGYKLKSLDNKQADYNGNYDIQPRGKLDDFQKYLKKLIIGNTPLEVAVTLGLSACVVGYIRLHTSVSNLICSIHGKTTTGKTTAAKLAISMGGNPYCGDDKISLAGTCSTTANAMYGQLRGNHGYPMLFDELGSISKSTDIEQMLYCLAEGEDKKRMTKSGDIRLLEKWSTTIIFTSEHPILNSNVQTGLNVRVINLADVEWTKSAEQARKIESFSRVFAGLGIDMLSDYIVKNASGIYQSYESYVSEISNNLKVDSSLKVRTSKPIAILKLTVELASKAFGVQFNVDEIVQFIVNAVEKEKPIPSWKKMYDEVLQHIEKDKNILLRKKPLFGDKNSMPLSSASGFSSCCGYVAYGSTEDNCFIPQYCVVTEEKMKDWCKEYKDLESNLRVWGERNLLERQKRDRIIRYEYISNSSAKVRCYKIMYNLDLDDYFTSDYDLREMAKSALNKLDFLKSQFNFKNNKEEIIKQIDEMVEDLNKFVKNSDRFGNIDFPENEFKERTPEEMRRELEEVINPSDCDYRITDEISRMAEDD